MEPRIYANGREIYACGFLFTIFRILWYKDSRPDGKLCNCEDIAAFLEIDCVYGNWLKHEVCEEEIKKERQINVNHEEHDEHEGALST